jgi:hypothetical protein
VKNLVPETGGFKEFAQKFELEEQVLQEATLLLDLPVEDITKSLGRQLQMVDNTLMVDRQMTKGIDFREMEAKFDLKQKAIEFLKKFWKKLCKTACAWWKKNKDKIGQTLVAQLSGAIVAANIIPPPFGWVGGIIATIAVLLIKLGLDYICKQLTAGKLPSLPL